MADAMTSFGVWVRRRRRALDMTQDDLALLVGCSKDLIVKIEGDVRRPSKQMADLLGRALQIAPPEHDLFVRAARAELAPDRLPNPTLSVPQPTLSVPTVRTAPAAAVLPILPSGTVTFLFTDIAGSTRRWEEQPDAMRQALARHDAIVRETIATHHGQLFKTMGDACCAAFAAAPDALAAAVAGQRALAAQDWGSIGALQVRMAVHTGTAVPQAGDYLGQPLNRVARLLNAGHGGQIVLSLATHELVRDHLPDGASLRDLGSHRFKDLVRPEPIFQLCAADLPTDFPALTSLDPRTTNLPVQVHALIGRTHAVAHVRELVGRTRLVTLTGPGGMGKTRLALHVGAEVVDQYPDGVWFIDLAPLSDPDQLAAALAQALGIPEASDRPIRERVFGWLQQRQILLLLDNCEQVIEGVASLVAEVLGSTTHVQILATSRIPLRIAAEQEYPVLPLDLPNPQALPPFDHLSQYDAVALFIARARAIRPDFMITNANAPAVAEICVRLDGVPLALELAAARIRLFPPEHLLSRLISARLQTLSGGARDLPPRQQTIRSTIAWSYRLLTAEQQGLFARLGVFVGGWTLDAAEVVCSAPGLDVIEELHTLVEHSLVRVIETQATHRFTLLETLREYALERLAEAGEATETRRRHAEYFVALAEAISAEGGEYEHSDERTRTDYANLRAVLGWCRTSGPGGVPEAELGMRLAKTLRLYWLAYDLYEGLRWLRELCGPAWVHGPPHLRARLLSSLGQYMEISISPNDQSQALAMLEEGVRLSREIGDMWALAEVCRHRSRVSKNREEELMWLAESLAAGRAAGSPWNIAWTQDYFIASALRRGDDEEAARLCEECLPVFQRLGYAAGVAHIVYFYSVALLRLGAFDRAAQLLDETLDSFHLDLSLDMLFMLYYQRGQVAYAQSDLRCASDLFVQALRFKWESAQQVQKADDAVIFQGGLGVLAVVVAALGHHVHATHLFCHARERLWYPQPNLVQAQFGASLAACRAALGEEAFDAAWADGQALTLAQAVEEALAFTASPAATA